MTVAEGSYIKIGNICIISFYIQLTTPSTVSENPYARSLCYITGVPFTPSADCRWYGGGGHWQGGIYSEGYPESRFDGYVLQSIDSRIYPRTSYNGGADPTSSEYAQLNGGYICVGYNEDIHASGTIAYRIAD